LFLKDVIDLPDGHKMVTILVDDPGLDPKSNRSPIYTAVKNGRTEVVRELLRTERFRKILTSPNAHGKKVLDFARLHKQEDIIRLLKTAETADAEALARLLGDPVRFLD
jgi:hypothetical protein